MYFDIEADSSGFVSAMKSVQDSVLTTYQKIEKQNKELDESLEQAQKDIADAIKNTSDELKELEEEHEKFEKSLDSMSEAMDKAFDAGDMEGYAKIKAQLEEGLKIFDEQAETIDKAKEKLEEYIDKQNLLEETTTKVAEARRRDKNELVELLGGQEKYNTIVSALPPALQNSQGGIMNMVKAAKAFIATPLGAVIAAIALAVKSLMSYFTSTVEGERAFAKVTGYLQGVMAKLNDVLVKVGEALYNLFTNPKEAMESFKDALVENIINRFNALIKNISIAGDLLKDIFTGDWTKLSQDAKAFGDQMMTMATGIEDVSGKMAKFAEEVHNTASDMADLAAREKKLELDRSNWSVERTKLEAKRNQIMEKMYEGTYQEQLESAKEAIEINNKIAAQDRKLAKEAYEIVKTRNSLASSNTSDVVAENSAAAELSKVDVEASAANKRLANRIETLSKTLRNAEALMSEQQKEALVQLSRDMQDSEIMAAENVIASMNEGAKKQMEARELNHKKQLIQIERQEQDSVKAARDAAKSAWAANTKEHSNEAFDDTLLSKTGSEYDQLSDADKNVVDNYIKAVNEARKRAAIAMEAENISFFDVNDLISQYKDFDAKRIDIEEKYAAEKKRLQDSLQEAETKGNQEMVESIKSALRQIDMSEAKDKMQNAIDKLKADPAFIDAFQDLKSVSTDTLETLLKELEANKEALSSIDPENLRVLTDLMSNMQDEIADRSGAFEAYAVAVDALKKAEENKATADAKAIKYQKEYDAQVKLSGKDSVEAKSKLMQLNQAKKEQNAATDAVVKALNKERKAFKQVEDQVEKLVESIKNVGNAIGGEAGQVTELISSIYDFTKSTIESVKSMTATAVTTMSAMEKASVILLIISAAIQVFQKLHEILNKFSDSAAFDKAVEKQKAINKLADAVNEYTLAVMKAENEERNWFGEDTMRTLRTNANEMAEVYKDYYEKLYQQQVAYRNKSRNDNNWTVTMAKFIDPTVGTTIGTGMLMGMRSTYDAAYTRAIDNLRIETQRRKKSFMGIGGRDQETEDLRSWAKQKFKADLFDADGWINGTLAQQIIDSYGDKLQGETEDTLKQLIELKEQYDEYMQQLKDYVGQLYEPLVTNFTDSIMDWLDTGKDALNSFEQYASEVFRNIVQDMMNTIVLDKVVGTFQDEILSMYEDYSKGNLTEEDLMKKVAIRTSEMVNTYEEQIPILQQIATNMKTILEETTGIDVSSSGSVSASSGMQTSFSQSSIDEANGRMASLQIGQQAQVESLASIASSMPIMVSLVGDTNIYLSDLRDMAGLRNSMLSDMSENMVRIYNSLSSKLSSIDYNTKNL